MVMIPFVRSFRIQTRTSPKRNERSRKGYGALGQSASTALQMPFRCPSSPFLVQYLPVPGSMPAQFFFHFDPILVHSFSGCEAKKRQSGGEQKQVKPRGQKEQTFG